MVLDKNEEFGKEKKLKSQVGGNHFRLDTARAGEEKGES